MIVFRVLAAAFLLAGAGLASCASRRYDERSAFLDRARPATAEVVEVIRQAGSGRRASSWSAYRLRFTTAAGRVVDAEADDTDGFTEHRKGETVPVVYDPDDPARVGIDTFSHRWSRVGLPAVLGTGFLVEGLLLFWISAVRVRDPRTELTGPEIWRAFKEGRLRRDSEFQPVLLGLSFVGVASAVATTLVVLFAGTGLKILLAALFLYAVFLAWRGIRKGRGASS